MTTPQVFGISSASGPDVTSPTLPGSLGAESGLAAARAFGLPGSGAGSGAEGLGLSAELMEELQGAGQGFNPLSALQATGNTQSQFAQLLQVLIMELVQLQHQLAQQMRDQDQEGAQGTLAQMRDIEGRLNNYFGGQAGGSSAAPGGSYSGGPSASGGGTPSGGGTSSGGGAGEASSASGAGANAVEATPEDFKGDSPIGRELAALAVKHATDGTGDGGHCYRNVGQDLEKIGIHTSGEGAWMAADQLAGNSKVQELKGISNDELSKLPAGAIVVWNKGEGHPYGHISIATGDGREASDVMRKQITNYGTSYRVFVPKDGGGK